MLHDSVPRGPDRRRSPRFPLPIGRVSDGEITATLLNISRFGMAIEVPETCGFAMGEAHSFTLQDLRNSVEVRGRVRWVRSDWRDHGGPGRMRHVQVVGLTFEEIMTHEPSGIWSNLQTIDSREPVAVSVDTGPFTAATTVSTRTVSAIQPESPCLIEPGDGSNVFQPTVNVICRIAIPEEVTSVSINGISATIEGGEAMATIELDPGLNLLTVLIWRQDGSYRSYSLGRVTRKE